MICCSTSQMIKWNITLMGNFHFSSEVLCLHPLISICYCLVFHPHEAVWKIVTEWLQIWQKIAVAFFTAAKKKAFDEERIVNNKCFRFFKNVFWNITSSCLIRNLRRNRIFFLNEGMPFEVDFEWDIEISNEFV